MTCKECDSPVWAKGLCSKHYQQVRAGIRHLLQKRLDKSDEAQRRQETRDFLNVYRAIENKLKRRKDLAQYLPHCQARIEALAAQVEEAA